MLDLVVRRARIQGSGRRATDIGVVDGRIVSLADDLPAGQHEIDAAGRLVVPGFVDSHLHLDKSHTLDRCTLTEGTLSEAIRETARIKTRFSESDIYQRASRTLDDCILQGTTRVRSQVEVDTTVELRGYDAIAQLAADYATAVDVQICVFAQEGLTNSPSGVALLTRALERGAHLVGGAPYADPDPIGQLDLVFALARRFDVDVDLHLDLAETVDGMLLAEVCQRTVAQGWQGRVTVGHVTQLSLVHPDRYEQLCSLVADAGVAMTVLPATDLFLMGRAAPVAKPRGVVHLAPLMSRGAACSIATNNVVNAFTPYGDCSLVRMANLYANITHAVGQAELEECLDLVTSAAARVMGADDYGIRLGSPADLVCLDAHSEADAIARIVPALWGLKGGRPTFTRARPLLCTAMATTKAS
ncbi:MAG: amidohydrolase family protein [Frankia sp.]